ncbi:hypothetical protein FPQ18DRAFT_262248 [Pyronema domesticum]|nr:hypothetical protein FPQ18DRAFT_262248 [Pyronema domesticum]
MGWISEIYKSLGKYKDAEKLNLKSLETRKRVLGDEHPDILISMSNLAHVLMNLSRTVEAIEMMQRAARLQNKVLGAEHRSTKGSYQTFAEWTAEHNAAISFDTDSDGAETDTEID